MSFINYFRLLSHLLVLCGFSALVITNFYSFAFAALFLLIVIYSWKREETRLRIEIPKWLINMITLGYFVYLVIDVFWRSGDIIGEGVDFATYLQIVKLIGKKENRDWFQMYIMSFVHLVSSSVLTESVAFAIPFVTYIILATWTFTIYNMKSQYEEAVAPSKGDPAVFFSSKTLITRRFLLVTSLLSLVVITSTMVIFFSFPRMSMGYFYRKISSKQPISGFSEQIDLGSIGSIINSSAVAMRVETPDRKMTEEILDGIYWRGTAFDSYDGRRWSRSDRSKEKKLIDVQTGMIELDKAKLDRNLLVQKIFLEPMDTRIVFAADEVRIIRWEKLKIERYMRKEIGIERDAYSTNYFLSDLASDQNYFAYSDISAKKRYLPVSEEPDYPEDLTYLELPYRDERTARLVDGITKGAVGDHEKALKIEEYLKRKYSYSDERLDLEAERPLESFLFDLKRGHCELFSTAMAVILRYAGIPSRNAVGFRGGSINDVGNYIVVRQSDAHSWVEAYIWGNGWMRFDPTPGLDERHRASMANFGIMAKYLDYLKLRWSKYIVDYDLRSQSRYARIFITGAGKFFGGPSWLDRLDLKRNAGQRGGKAGLNPFLHMLLILSGAVLSFIMLKNLISYYRRPARAGKLSVITVLYINMLRALEKRGVKKGASQTPLEFSSGLIKDGRGEVASTAHKLTEKYYDVRFGGRRLTDEVQSSFEQGIRRLKGSSYRFSAKHPLAAERQKIEKSGDM